jgi:hypothetical protein
MVDTRDLKLTRTIQQAIEYQRIPPHGKKIECDSLNITLDGFVLIWTENGPQLVPQRS